MIVLVHGFTGHTSAWEPVVAALPEAMRRQVQYAALLGHAPLGPLPQVQTFWDEVDRLARIHLGDEPVHLVGYSLGARLCLGLASRRPERILSMTLFGANAGLARDEERAERAAADALWLAQIRSLGVERFLAAWDKQALFGVRSAQPHFAALLRQRLQHTPEGLCQALETLSLARMSNLEEVFRSTQFPIRLVTGGEDAKFVRLAQRYKRDFPHLHMRTVAKAAHDVPGDNPVAAAQVIAQTVGRL